jgi:signal peptidase I
MMGEKKMNRTAEGSRSPRAPDGGQEGSRLAPEEVIRERRDRIGQKESVWHFVVKLVVVLAALYLVFHFVYGLDRVTGNDMYPRILDGDLLLFYRLPDKIEIGDIVVFHVDGIRRSGRVVAQGGDVVDIGDGGKLLINGNIQEEEVFYPTEARGTDLQYPYKVPQHSVFILCDYRTEATDSRTFGAVSDSNLEGKLISIFRRRGM